ncbi:MAG: S9 family peptidase [Bacteroidales bacterium]|nr:S9 family peptidase [Bacteroidales bacterium]
MKRLLIPIAMLLFVLQGCDTKQDVPLRETIKLDSDVMTPEVLWSMGRIGEFDVSPDGSQVVYSVTDYSIEKNKGISRLYVMNADGSNLECITEGTGSQYSPTWTLKGKIAYMAVSNGEMQLWEMDANGMNNRQISVIDGGITGYLLSPDEKMLVYTAEVKLKDQVADIYRDLPLSSGRINNDLMYRHWDQWVDTYSHIFVADMQKGVVRNGKDIMEGEMWESPVRPFGGMEQVAWTADGENILYCCRKKVGKEYATSTNTDIYRYNVASGNTVNLTEGMMGYDLNIAVSPKGNKMAWESMERDGYEADKQRLFVMDLTTGEKKDYTSGFDQNATSLTWSADGNTIYFISDKNATDQIYALSLGTGSITKITEGKHNFVSVAVAGKNLIGGMQSMSRPTELYSVDTDNGEFKAITHVNDNIFNQLKTGNVEERWIRTTDGKMMLTWVIYPPHFDRNKKYPTLLYCEGGPQSTVSQFWSYRWNFQMMAANGYVIVAPNRRGLPGFGQEWNEAISGDYGGQCMKDYLTAIDVMSEEPFVDNTRLGAVGASFGGFSVYWLAGHHDGRFKALIAHDGMFNLDAQYLETEEMWFVNWDLGGPFWEKDNPVVKWSYDNSPHLFVDKWTAPILVIHGGLDYRICFTQGMQAYNAAVMRGIPAEFLYFPDENHWVLQPQNGILWQRRFANWLDTYLK